jgi:hypothetical protein
VKIHRLVQVDVEERRTAVMNACSALAVRQILFKKAQSDFCESHREMNSGVEQILLNVLLSCWFLLAFAPVQPSRTMRS